MCILKFEKHCLTGHLGLPSEASVRPKGCVHLEPTFLLLDRVSRRQSCAIPHPNGSERAFPQQLFGPLPWVCAPKSGCCFLCAQPEVEGVAKGKLVVMG